MPGLLAIGAVTSIGLGAILVFAVDWQWDGADRMSVGLIMMVVGMLALLVATHMSDHDSHEGKTP
ncbi:hypothetical protein LG634_32145 [Streptomyces bambusae]|uniref:hypothetical protein n=1 Tax=Streptomyces bambusae TaxID=1550616 RepID=UPI001CFF56E5|nr:hypothetical protein [Streptomyces bambusae]MCB5169448.1 hypothetical protein [Streptomyces bambusae]